MEIITRNEKNCKRYLPHEVTTKVHAVESYRKVGDIAYICRKYHVSKASLMRWNKLYDGTKESLAPKIIQTDNGAEFTNFKKTNRVHIFDQFCDKYGIEHKLIRPRTSWHNGKVERSHRNDQERFYNYLKFYSYDDLLVQMKRYLKRANNIPMAVLGWKSPKKLHDELGD